MDRIQQLRIGIHWLCEGSEIDNDYEPSIDSQCSMSQDEAACNKVKTDTGSQGCEFKVFSGVAYCTVEDASAATSVQDACNQVYSWDDSNDKERTSEEMTAACTGAGACKMEESTNFQCLVFDPCKASKTEIACELATECQWYALEAPATGGTGTETGPDEEIQQCFVKTEEYSEMSDETADLCGRISSKTNCNADKTCVFKSDDNGSASR